MIIFSFSERVALCSKFDFWTLSYGRSYEIAVFCPFVCPLAVRHQEWVVSFFQIFCIMIDNWNIYKLQEPFFPGKFIFPKI